MNAEDVERVALLSAMTPAELVTFEREEKARLVEVLVADLAHHGATRDRLTAAFARVGRDHAPGLLLDLDWSTPLAPEVLAWAAPHAWSGVEHPLAALHAETWADWFARAGFTVEGVPADRPGQPVVVFRGADHAHRLGWSWTDDPDLARWFAERPRHRERGQVWRAAVAPWALLARITEQRPGENEWVVDPAGLLDVAEWDGTER